MSKLVTTDLGRFNCVTDNIHRWFLWECPNCKQLSTLNENTLQRGCTCPAIPDIQDLWRTLIATMQARIFMGEKPTDLEGCEVYMPGSQPAREGGK
jgi:hypothetical protein